MCFMLIYTQTSFNLKKPKRIYVCTYIYIYIYSYALINIYTKCLIETYDIIFINTSVSIFKFFDISRIIYF